jgi:hypothetical protein
MMKASWVVRRAYDSQSSWAAVLMSSFDTATLSVVPVPPVALGTSALALPMVQ